MNKQILMLSAYDATSHRAWRERLQALFPRHDWTVLALPPRHFNWRIRSNSLQWALREGPTLNRDYDLIIATSMVDLSSLRGLVPSLANTHAVVYFHENQFAYPASARQQANLEPLLVPVYSALSAEAVVFNSRYNRETFLGGVRDLFARLPDKLAPDILQRLASSQVIPVPLPERALQPRPPRDRAACLELVWNHRWEYDKGPQRLLALARAIAEGSLPLRLHVVGEQFRDSPGEFGQLGEVLRAHHERMGFAAAHFGFIDEEETYRRLLGSCDVVLSTALHDFQGLAIQEAIQLGCTPLCPAALAYPEYLTAEFLYSVDGDDAAVSRAIVERLLAWRQLQQAGDALPRATVEHCEAAAVRRLYTELFDRLMP